MKTNPRRLISCSKLLFLAVFATFCMINSSYAAPYHAPRKPAKAMIMEFGFFPGSGANDYIAHGITQAVAQEFNRKVKNPDPDQRSFYRIENLIPLPNLGSNTKDPVRYPVVSPKIVRLVRSKGADILIFGTVTNITFGSSAGKRFARLVVDIRVLNAVTDEFENSAIASGYSTYSTTDAKKVNSVAVLSEATSDAVHNAVRTICRYGLPITTVTTVENRSVSLNRGERDGIVVGQRMVIVCDQKVVGYIQINGVRESNADAISLSARYNLKQGDHAQAIFILPTYNVKNESSIRSAPALKRQF